MTRSIYLWTRWNSSVISCSKINVYFSIVAVTNKLFFFSLISVLGTHTIRFCILSLSFTIYFETFYFIRHNLADSIPTFYKHRVCRMGFISDLKCIRLFSNFIGSRSLIDKHCHTLGICRVVTIGKIILSSFLFISRKLN